MPQAPSDHKHHEFKEGAELIENGGQYKIFGLVLPEIILTPVFMEAKLSSDSVSK